MDGWVGRLDMVRRVDWIDPRHEGDGMMLCCDDKVWIIESSCFQTCTHL